MLDALLFGKLLRMQIVPPLIKHKSDPLQHASQSNDFHVVHALSDNKTTMHTCICFSCIHLMCLPP